MKAMVLAAGLGTRLGALTKSRPKALAEVSGRTLLEITLGRLRGSGIVDVVINVHHLGDMIVDYLKANGNFGMNIAISREDVLLDTGGGLKKAAWFFLDSAGQAADEPFVMHNVDIVSSIDIARMAETHRRAGALATLAVQNRVSSRYLFFDESMSLCGRLGQDQKVEMVRAVTRADALAFAGIHVISPRLLPMIEEQGAFSIITTYLRLASTGERILSFRADGCYWRDLGKPDDLRQTAADFENNLIPGLEVRP